MCNFSREARKERLRPRSYSEQNKVCQRCFLCKSMSFCPICSKCPTCCHRSQCWGKASELLASLAESGFKSQSSVNLRNGYTLPFRERPHLSRFPLIVSRYSSPTKNKALSEALASLLQKQAVEKVVVKSSLAFYNRHFLVPKPNKKWCPILDLSKLNLFLTANTFKMETPETIRLSLQKGEWVTSLDFSDAYFHIPISQRSRKYLRFHMNKVTFQFSVLPFGLAVWNSPKWSRR